jgi:hypothetical protein
VAAYAANLLIGGVSEEVSGYGQSTLARGVLEDFRPASESILPAVTTAARPHTCADSTNAYCYKTTLLAAIASSVNAIASASDGRVLIVEDGQRVRVLERNTLLQEFALVASRATIRLTVLVLDPNFEQTHHIFVEETELLSDGTRELSIVRYREVQNTLGERAVIVTGIRLAAAGTAPFTIDSNNRIFIAVPSTGVSSTPYGGVVLGFEADGGALRQNPAASPIVAQGFARPTGILWDAAAQQLWLSGVDEHASSTVARIPLDASAPAGLWPRVPRAVVISSQGAVAAPSSRQRGDDDHASILLLPLPGGFSLVRVGRDAVSVMEVPDIEEGEITAATTALSDSAYVVSHIGRGGSRIVKIEQP